jgi:hypothetical protein
MIFYDMRNIFSIGGKNSTKISNIGIINYKFNFKFKNIILLQINGV